MIGAGSSPTDAAGKILDAAEELFYERGIASVGVDTIVARSGASKATLYRHFRSKEELVAASLRRADEAWRAELAEEVERRASTPREQLLAVFDWLKERFQSDGFRGCAFINAAADIADDGHPAHAMPGQHKREVRKVILRLAREAGLASPAQLADDLMLLMDGAMVRALLERSAASATRAKRIASLLIDAQSTASPG